MPRKHSLNVNHVDTLGRLQPLRYKYPYATIPVDGIFLVRGLKNISNCRSAVSRYARTTGKVFSSRKIQSAVVRITRIR